MFALSIWLLSAVSATRGAMRPNIVFIMADDLGWGNVGWHNPRNRQIKTPNLDALAATGLELTRMYVYRGCAPTRSSFQSGRLPVHVTTTNRDGISTPESGIPAEMTGIASKLKEADYSTHLIGKWDAGFASFAHLPINKGYDSFFGYLGKAIGYFDSMSYNDCPNLGDVDLWEDDHPAFESVEAMTEALNDDDGYIEFTFKRKMLDLLDQYADDETDTPFFAMYSSHLPHFPLQIPQDRLEADIYDFDESMCASHLLIFPEMDYNNDAWECRTIAQSQVHLLDEIVGEIVDRLKTNGQWENTLLIFQSDNGGSLQLDSSAGNNYPLRGGKLTDFEGGIRAVTVVSGGALPEERRGQVEDGLMHIADWYVTFCAMLGVDPSDQTAIDAGLPDVDGFDVWPLISGEETQSPRTELVISTETFISGEFKLMRGAEIEYAHWQAPIWPDASTPLLGPTIDCSPPNRCLFNVASDASEFENVANVFPDVYAELSTRFDELSQDFYENDRTGWDSCPNNYHLTVTVKFEEVDLSCGCWMALHNYNGFNGPWQDLSEDYVMFADSAPEQFLGNTAGSEAEQFQNDKQAFDEGDHEHFEIGGDIEGDEEWHEWILNQNQLISGHIRETADAHPDLLRGEIRKEDIDVERLEVQQKILDVVKDNDMRWSNKATVEHAWMLVVPLLFAMICFSGAYRQWSMGKQYTGIGEKVSKARMYGTNNV